MGGKTKENGYRVYSDTYLFREYENTLSAVKIVEKWLRQEPTVSKHIYSRKDAAFLLDTTPESIRIR